MDLNIWLIGSFLCDTLPHLDSWCPAEQKKNIYVVCQNMQKYAKYYILYFNKIREMTGRDVPVLTRGESSSKNSSASIAVASLHSPSRVRAAVEGADVLGVRAALPVEGGVAATGVDVLGV